MLTSIIYGAELQAREYFYLMTANGPLFYQIVPSNKIPKLFLLDSSFIQSIEKQIIRGINC